MMPGCYRRAQLLGLCHTKRACRYWSVLILLWVAWLGAGAMWNLSSHLRHVQHKTWNAAPGNSSAPVLIGDARSPHAGAMLPNWLCWTAHRARVLDFVAVVNKGETDSESAGTRGVPSARRALGAHSAGARPASFPHNGCVPGSHADVISLLSLAMSLGRGFWYAPTDILLLQDVRRVLPASCDVGYDGNEEGVVGDGLPLAVHPSSHGQRFWARLHHCQGGAWRRRGLAGMAAVPTAPALSQACMQHALTTPGLTACSWASIDAFMYARSLQEYDGWGPKATGVWPLAVRVTPHAEESAAAGQGEGIDGLMERPSGAAHRRGMVWPARQSDVVLVHRTAAQSATTRRAPASGSSPDTVSRADAAPIVPPSFANKTDHLLHTLGLQAVSTSGACHVHPPGVPPPARLASFGLTIRVLTMSRPESLARLLRFLAMVDFMGDKVDLVIAVDVPRRGDWVFGWWLLLVEDA